VLLLAADKELLVGDAGSGAGGGVDALDNNANLALGVVVVKILIVEVGDDLRGGVVVAVNEKPPGRLG
jgi:hypothetical protein